MAKFGCPLRFIESMWRFHDSTQARIQNDGQFSESFQVTNGVIRDRVMAPSLFNMMFSAMPLNAVYQS